MKKQYIIVVAIALVILAGVAYFAGSINTNKDKVGADGSAQNINTLDFGYLGYVYQKDTVTSLTEDKVLPQATRYDSEFNLVFPSFETEKQIYFSSSDDSSSDYAVSAAIVGRDLIEISQYQEGGNLADPATILITSAGDRVDCAGTQCLWSMPDAADGNVVSPNYQYLTKVSYQEPSEENPDVPMTPTFKTLDVMNHDNEVLYSFRADEYSKLGAIFPVAFSPDSSSLLLRAGYVQPHEMFLPRKYYLQKLGDEKMELISFNSDTISINGNYEEQEVDFIDFVNSYTLFGSKVAEVTSEGISQVRTYSLVTFDVESKILREAGVGYRELIDFDEENTIAYYFDNQGHYSSYNFITQNEMILTPDFTFPEYSSPMPSSDFRFLKYEVITERETQNVRGTLNINGANNKDLITDIYIYDVANQTQTKILTSVRNKSGDAIGDEFYAFVGFIQSDQNPALYYDYWRRYKKNTDPDSKSLGSGYCGTEGEFNDLRVRAEAGEQYIQTLPGNVVLIWTPNYTDFSTDKFVALGEDPNSICGVAPVVPLKAYPDRLLWYTPSCGGVMPLEGTAAYDELQACEKSVKSVKEYFSG